METNGQLSVLPRAQNRTAEAGDVLDQVADKQRAMLLVLDGNINERALRESGLDKRWLEKRLREQGAKDVRRVFVAGIDEDGTVYVQMKEDA